MKRFWERNKVTIIVISIILIFLFSFFYKTSAYTYENLDFKYGKVTAKTTLNIRCGPGTNYERVGSLKQGEYISVFAKVGEWYIVQTDGDIIGAVSSKYIEPVYDEKVEDTIKMQESIGTSGEIQQTSQYIDNLELTEEEKEFLNLINLNRKNNGLEELKIDNAIQNVARLKAQDLERNDYFSHTSPTYGNIEDMLKSFDISFVNTQENIAGNQTLSGAVEAWMNSQSHKANILNNSFNYTGVALVESKTYGKIFVEVFVKK